MTIYDNKVHCPHGHQAAETERPDIGPGFLEYQAPAECKHCKPGLLLSIAKPAEDEQPPDTAEPAPVVDVPDSASAEFSWADGLESVLQSAFSKIRIATKLARSACIRTGKLESAFLMAAYKLDELENTSDRQIRIVSLEFADRLKRIVALENEKDARSNDASRLAERVDELGKNLDRQARLKAECIADNRERIEKLERSRNALTGAERRHLDNYSAKLEAEELGRAAAEKLIHKELCFRCFKPLGNAAAFNEAGVGRRHVDDSPGCKPVPPRRRVILESPFAGGQYVEYARAAMLDSLSQGEAPFPSHLLYTQVLDDDVPGDRLTGMSAGWAWLAGAEAVVVYTDRGVSDGMVAGIARARAAGLTVELRQLNKSLPGDMTDPT